MVEGLETLPQIVLANELGLPQRCSLNSYANSTFYRVAGSAGVCEKDIVTEYFDLGLCLSYNFEFLRTPLLSSANRHAHLESISTGDQ